MKKMLLFLSIATTLMSCKETCYVTSYQTFQNAVQSLNSELANDGFGINGFQQILTKDIDGVVTNYYPSIGVSVSNPILDVRIHDSYSLKDSCNRELSYTICYQIAHLWGKHYYAKDIHVESLYTSEPSVFEQYSNLVYGIENPPQDKFQRTEPFSVIMGVGGTILGTVIIINAIEER